MRYLCDSRACANLPGLFALGCTSIAKVPWAETEMMILAELVRLDGPGAWDKKGVALLIATLCQCSDYACWHWL